MVKRLTHLLLFFIPIICSSQVSYNFESGNLAGWTQVPSNHWASSTSSPINGSYSLKHTFNNTVAATDRLSLALPSWNPNSGSITWQVKVRHGYDPSSSNRWWIFLMSDMDANQMQLGGMASGYVIGVNLTDNDDLLKLWRIDNGIPQVVLTSTLDWQTLIGKANAGAVEVDRKPNGTFTLKASTSGLFSSLTNYGNAMDNNYSDFNYFGICYNYTSTADQLLWVDDISFSYSPLNKNDLTSEVLNPVSQINTGSISSTSISSDLAVDVMKFQIKDYSTLDILPTRVKRLVFKKVTSSNPADWIKAIAGARLKDSNSDVSIINQIICEDEISIEVDTSTLIISNSQVKEYTLGLYLKQDSLVDGSSLKMMIDSAHHGFEAGLSGSDFLNTFSQKVTSNEFKISVDATHLKFQQVPVSVSKNVPFTLSLVGADNGGNLDKDFASSISLALSQGNGVLSSPSGLTKNPTLGVATWNDLVYNSRGKLKIRAISSTFLPVLTDDINVLNDTTSTINQPTSQPNGVAISSLSCFPARAVEVLRFSIFDQGNSDSLPTIIKNIKLSRVETTDAASLSKSLEGILMKVNGSPISISQPDIKTSYLTFSVENLVVPDGEYKDVSIFIYLKNQGLTDNQKIQFKVDSVNHGFTTDSKGSAFKSIFPQQVISNIFWIDVNASQLKFSSTPSRVGVLQPFNVVLSATDINGNIDKNFSGSTNLILLNGGGTLLIPTGSINNFTSGNCIYDSLTYSIPGRFSLLASSTTLNNISSSLITCGDADGGINPLSTPQNQVLLSSISTNADHAVEVIGLNAFDGGSTDGMPLIISKISLHCFDPSKADQLNRQIGGFVVKVNSKPIKVELYSLNDGVFEITPKSGDLVIPDGDTISLSISIYLSKGGIIDNFPFQFYIPAANHGWEASTSGTGFASNLTSSVYGPVCRTVVEATSLRFIKTPFIVSPAEQFSIKISAVDAFGSIDNDYSDQITLRLDYGTGAFTCSKTNQNLVSGYAEWIDVQLSKPGTYRFKANSVILGNSLSGDVYCGLDHDCLIHEDFEGSPKQDWVGFNEWLLSTISPINGSKSLQHKQNENSGESVLSIPIDIPTMGDKLIEWNFTLRNGNWNPTTDNFFYFALMATSSGLVSDTISGFFVGVNPSFGNSQLTLWRLDRGAKTSLISTTYNWSADDEIMVKVGLTPKGDWKLWYSPKDSPFFVLGGECKSSTESLMDWCGLVFNYTSTRAGQLWLDDLSICNSDYPPVLKSAKALNLNTVQVQFSEEINSDEAFKISNYSIIDANSEIINIVSATNSSDKPRVIIKTVKLPFGELKLKVNGIKGLNGSSIKDSINFGLGEQGTFGRLIINEIMANPMPSKGLPEYEYIELFNPTIDTILLKGWRLNLNNYSLYLPSDSLLPKQYAVLCSTSSATAMKAYGKSIGITSFPALLNGGMKLKLYDPSASLISLVDYNDNWYGEGLKKEGGWSLEKVDYQNLMEGKNNWRASHSLIGGTPCTVNSIVDANPDITTPRVLSLEMVTDHSILLQFSEPMDSLMLTYTSNYEIDSDIGHPANASLVGDDYSKVILTLSEPISSDIIYNLCFRENITDFSGNHLVSDCMQFGLPQVPVWNDIVINEVLFNPNTGGVDFVEIYNRSNKTFDLSKMFLSNRNSSSDLLDQVYRITDTSKFLFPQDYGVITTSPALVKMFYHTENDKAFIIPSGMASFNNDFGHVVLLGVDSTVIDEFHYTESMHSKLLNDLKGVSLERINPNFESASTSTWHSAAQTVGYATPTYKNSQWVEPSQKEDEFTLTPELFSPDGDGRDDYLLISYRLPQEGSIANIRVFDSEGREVRRLASNLLVGTQGTITWDGLDSKNQRVPFGMYIVYIEYFNPNGSVKKFKKTCVVVEKL